YARTVKNSELGQAIERRAQEYYLGDRDYASEYEPSGEDFFSASLNEADLMRRIPPTQKFTEWLDRFLVQTRASSHAKLLTPVVVSDVTDGKLVHLAGLNLSRAWTLAAVADALPENAQWKALFAQAA
ncbi:MAG: DUF2891 family protein, partial [Pirellula sp.]